MPAHASGASSNSHRTSHKKLFHNDKHHFKSPNSYYYMQYKTYSKRSSSGSAVPMSSGRLCPSGCWSGRRRGRVEHGTQTGPRYSRRHSIPCPTIPRWTPEPSLPRGLCRLLRSLPCMDDTARHIGVGRHPCVKLLHICAPKKQLRIRWRIRTLDGLHHLRRDSSDTARVRSMPHLHGRNGLPMEGV